MMKLEEKTEIRVKSEYRKCVVYIPAQVSIATSARDGCSLVRQVMREAEEHEALFHCFAYKKANYRIYGDAGSQISETYAIVEYEDGTIHRIEPWNIRFVDGMINQYGFWEDNHVSKCED